MHVFGFTKLSLHNPSSPLLFCHPPNHNKNDCISKNKIKHSAIIQIFSSHPKSGKKKTHNLRNPPSTSQNHPYPKAPPLHSGAARLCLPIASTPTRTASQKSTASWSSRWLTSCGWWSTEEMKYSSNKSSKASNQGTCQWPSCCGCTTKRSQGQVGSRPLCVCLLPLWRVLMTILSWRSQPRNEHYVLFRL